MTLVKKGRPRIKLPDYFVKAGANERLDEISMRLIFVLYLPR